VILALMALAAWVAVPAVPDTLPFVLDRVGGIDSLSTDASRPVEPAGLAFDSFGRVYVSDAALRRLVRFEAGGKRLGETGGLGDEAGGLRRPGAVVTAGVLQVAVLDEENRRVVAYDLQGHVQGVAVDLDAAMDAAHESRVRPIGLGSDRAGAFYVADADGDRIVVFDAAGTRVRELGGPGAGGTALRGVAGIAVARRGDVFVSERVRGRIVRLDPTGALAAAWPLPDSTTALRLPLAVDDSMRVACADPVRGRVWVFDGAGALLASAGIDDVAALAFARDGALWVAERGARRLSRYTLAPRPHPTEP
jgi:DNA-binding beta-propeller fold protein YncE